MSGPPKPRPAGIGLRKVEEPHPVAAGAATGTGIISKTESHLDSRRAGQPASKLASVPVVTITHRVPRDLRDRLKIAAIRADRREQDVVAEALGEWLDRQDGPLTATEDQHR